LEFFDHNFAPRNASKSIKGSKDLYYSLESNKVLSHITGSLDQPMTSWKDVCWYRIWRWREV